MSVPFILLVYLKQKIDTSCVDFSGARGMTPDQPFLWGTATAAYQVEGNTTNSQWSAWEFSFNCRGEPRIQNFDKSGEASGFWNLFPSDISRMKRLGLHGFRFSIEWSKWEPRPGLYDNDVIKVYP